jgi:hypothetical protein
LTTAVRCGCFGPMLLCMESKMLVLDRGSCAYENEGATTSAAVGHGFVGTASRADPRLRRVRRFWVMGVRKQIAWP